MNNENEFRHSFDDYDFIVKLNASGDAVAIRGIFPASWLENNHEYKRWLSDNNYSIFQVNNAAL